jgi:mycofactocin precursor
MAQGAIIVWVPDTIKEKRMDDKNVVTDVDVETLVEDVSIDGMCGVY